MTDRRQSAHIDGAPVSVVVGEAGLDLGDRVLSWLDVDDVLEGDHRVRLGLADGSALELTALGTTHDGFMVDLRGARRRVRLAALTVATGAPLVSFESHAPAGWVDVHVFDKALVAEPRTGAPTAVPLPLIDRVDREGYTLTVHARGLEPLVIRALGNTTDEFLMRLDAARHALMVATAAAYASFDDGLSGFTAPDGWAVTAAAGGSAWGVLKARASAGERAEEMALLASLTGDRLALGLYTDGGASALPFALATVGTRVAVEAVDTDDRATFVFEAPDLARLNAVLLLTSFRREALSLPMDQLGRWAVAARTSAVVQEARAALVARVVHDAGWATNVRRALGA